LLISEADNERVPTNHRCFIEEAMSEEGEKREEWADTDI
jgi:hypothetical protein